MNYLQAENITKSYGEHILFEKISVSLHKDDRVALIARNGAGKTSLLNIITGEDNADSGNIVFRNDIRFGYLPQDPIFNENDTIIEAVFNSQDKILSAISEYEKALLENDNDKLQSAIDKMELLKAWDYEAKVKQILTELKINDYTAKISELSGGQKKRVALAKVLISKPDIYILDEPTNHLDLEMIEWLEEYLMSSNITLLMVTHDRYFLDRVCNQILEIDNKQIYQYKGNYSYFLEKRDERINIFNTEVEKAKNLFRKELDWIRRMPKARTTKAKYRVEAFTEVQEKASQKTNEKNVKLNIKATRIGKKILEINYLSKSFGDKLLFKDFEYLFKQHDKIGIIGKNGTGKTTFLNIINGLEKADSGKFEVGETIVFGYYKQEGIKIDESKKVIDVAKEIAEVVTLGDGSKMTVSGFLNYFLFPPERQYINVSKLSGGERRRLYLMTVLMKSPNFLILDEPTNDLDIYTLNVLEDYISQFTGCVILVSHDRYFMDKLVDHIFVFEGDGKIKDFPGNYTDYRIKHKTVFKQLPIIKEEKKEITQPEKEKIRKLTFKEKIELEELDKNIATLENQKQMLENELSSGKLQNNVLIEKSNLLGKIIDEIELKTFRWIELSEI